MYGGFYADPAADCQVFHVCSRPRGFHSFLCPNGTIFHQTYLTCDFWYNSDCSEAESQYGINNQIQAEREQIDSQQSTYQSNRQATYNSGAQATYSPPDTLPGYNGRGVGMYGRQSKSLGIEEMSITTSQPGQEHRKRKRQLKMHARQGDKYSSAKLP